MVFSQEKLSQLSEPIDAQLACGVYLKLDKSAFRDLRNEFNVAQSALRKLSQNPSNDEIEHLQNDCLEVWGTLASTLFTQFTTITRDIELISWFIAAQILLDPTLESTANALQWLADLVEQQWDVLNPVLPEDKLNSGTHSGRFVEQTTAKIKAFAQLMGESEESSIVYAPLLQQPLIGVVTFYDFQSAQRKGGIPALKESVALALKEDKNAIQEKLNNAMRCFDEIERIEKVLITKTEEANVKNASLVFIKNLFLKFDGALQQLSGMSAKKKINTNADKDIPAPNNAEQESDLVFIHEEGAAISTRPDVQDENNVPLLLRADNLDKIAASNNMNRDLAFQLLREISDYFHVTEPHSPVSFMLEKAIRWGYLPLPELLQEMFKEQDENRMDNIFNAVGLDSKEKLDLPSAS